MEDGRVERERVRSKIVGGRGKKQGMEGKRVAKGGRRKDRRKRKRLKSRTVGGKGKRAGNGREKIDGVNKKKEDEGKE